MDLTVETILINELQLDPNNARKHSVKNINAICESLKLFGQRKPIVVDSNNVVVAGNGTVEAASKIGWKGVSAVRIPSDWDNEKIKAYALADNKTAELAEWNTDILLEQLSELGDNAWDISKLGFEMPELKVEEDFDTTPQTIGERFEVVIECDNENDQTALLIRLSEEGLRVRAIVI